MSVCREPRSQPPASACGGFQQSQARLHGPWEDGRAFSSSGCVCPHKRQWDSLVGGQGEGCQPRPDFRGLLWAPHSGLQLQDGLSCQPGSWQNMALRARDTGQQTGMVPTGSLQPRGAEGAPGTGVRGWPQGWPRQVYRSLCLGQGGVGTPPRSPCGASWFSATFSKGMPASSCRLFTEFLICE